ncbi:MAG: hypothetical protein Q8O00_11970, partial [Holophaga sp.]|nr:hypothetical protein [Holophaga sp.]
MTRPKCLPSLFFLYAAALFGGTAILQAGLFERDGYFHARLAHMLLERGISQSFPWTQLSTWQLQFCDKEFLYHLGMMPFARIGSDPILGARVFATLLSVAVLGALYLMLSAHKVRWALFFTALPLAAGGLFIARLGMIRSHVLSMLLLMVGLHFLLNRRWKALLGLGFLYAWCYTMPFVLVMTAVPFALGYWAARGGLDWKSSAAAGMGSVLGLALHPYSPLTLETFLTYVQVFRLGLQGSAKSGLELGNELYPYPLAVFFDIYPLVLILVPLVVIAAAYLALRRRVVTPETWGLVAAMLFWFGLTLATPRFVEYSVLLMAVAAAFVVRDGWPELEALISNRKQLRRGLALVALCLLLGFHLRSLGLTLIPFGFTGFYTHYQSKAAPPRFFTGASAWMKEHLAPGETVINLYWDDFPDLFYDGYRQHYLWGLDPTYSLRADREKTLWLERMRKGDALLDGTRMAKAFNARYLILRLSRAGAYPPLR